MTDTERITRLEQMVNSVAQAVSRIPTTKVASSVAAGSSSTSNVTNNYTTGVSYYDVDPVISVTSQSNTSANGTYDASGDIPSGAVAVVIDGYCHADDGDVEIQAKQDSGITDWRYVCRANNEAVGDDDSTGQAIIKLTADRKFDWNVIMTVVGGTNTADIRIVGYFA